MIFDNKNVTFMVDNEGSFTICIVTITLIMLFMLINKGSWTMQYFKNFHLSNGTNYINETLRVHNEDVQNIYTTR